ncbi:MAG: YdcF family protein [Candidatus Atribacteria bacterium]|nr:YdcF family protein [Candidatus Atribacteria bacterium]
METLFLLLRKIIIQILFPPGGIIVLILIIYFLLIKNKKKVASCLTIITVFFLFFLSSWLGENTFLRTLEDDFPSFQINSLEHGTLKKPMIVVLGGDIVENSLMEKKDDVEIGEITLARLFGAYQVYREIKCPILVSGGSLPGSSGTTPVAIMMKQVLEDFGVSSEDIYLESQSRTTYENAKFSLKEIIHRGHPEIILVTSAVHMRRSVGIFRNSKARIVPAPVNYLFENSKPGILDILPNRTSWDHNLRALHEWTGLLYYKLFYKQSVEGTV